MNNVIEDALNKIETVCAIMDALEDRSEYEISPDLVKALLQPAIKSLEEGLEKEGGEYGEK